MTHMTQRGAAGYVSIRVTVCMPPCRRIQRAGARWRYLSHSSSHCSTLADLREHNVPRQDEFNYHILSLMAEGAPDANSKTLCRPDVCCRSTSGACNQFKAARPGRHEGSCTVMEVDDHFVWAWGIYTCSDGADATQRIACAARACGCTSAEISRQDVVGTLGLDCFPCHAWLDAQLRRARYAMHESRLRLVCRIHGPRTLQICFQADFHSRRGARLSVYTTIAMQSHCFRPRQRAFPHQVGGSRWYIVF